MTPTPAPERPNPTKSRSLKKELVNRADYQSRHHTCLSIRYWIQAWYNPRRLHSTIGQQPPNEWEDNHYHHTAA